MTPILISVLHVLQFEESRFLELKELYKIFHYDIRGFKLLNRHYIMIFEEVHIVLVLMYVMLLHMFVGHLAVLIITQT